MKLFATQTVPRNSRRGFTLVEMLLSFGIFVAMLTLSLVAVQLFGLKEYTLGGTKLSAMGDAMVVLDQVRDAIRASKQMDVGNLSTTSNPATYSAVGTNSQAIGGALRLFPTTNSFPLTIYFLNTTGATNYLMMATSPDGTNFGANVTLASYVTNLMVFDQEDSFGNILSNNVNNRVIRMELDFYQWEYPVGYIGSGGGNAYDFFKVTTRISRRLLD